LAITWYSHLEKYLPCRFYKKNEDRIYISVTAREEQSQKSLDETMKLYLLFSSLMYIALEWNCG